MVPSDRKRKHGDCAVPAVDNQKWSIVYLFFVFCDAGHWTQVLLPARQTLLSLSHTPSPALLQVYVREGWCFPSYSSQLCLCTWFWISVMFLPEILESGAEKVLCDHGHAVGWAVLSIHALLDPNCGGPNSPSHLRRRLEQLHDLPEPSQVGDGQVHWTWAQCWVSTFESCFFLRTILL